MISTPIGIDIAKSKFDAAALRNDKYKTKVFARRKRRIALSSPLSVSFFGCGR